MSETLPFLTAADVDAALDYPSLVEALREAFVAGASVPVRSSHEVTPAGDRLLLMPAWDGGGLGVKIVTVFPRNRARGLSSVAALYVLMDGATGHPQRPDRRRGPDAAPHREPLRAGVRPTWRDATRSRLLVIGTGALAPTMAEAHCAVRAIERVEVWGRSAERAGATAARLAAAGLPAQAAGDSRPPSPRRTSSPAQRPPPRRSSTAPTLRPGTCTSTSSEPSRRAMRECDDEAMLRATRVRRHVRRRAQGSRRPRAAARRRDDRGRATCGRNSPTCAPGRHPGRATRRRDHAVQVGRHRARGPLRGAAGRGALRRQPVGAAPTS